MTTKSISFVSLASASTTIRGADATMMRRLAAELDASATEAAPFALITRKSLAFRSIAKGGM